MPTAKTLDNTRAAFARHRRLPDQNLAHPQPLPAPAQTATLKKLRTQLMPELEANQDPRLSDAFDRPPYLDKARE